MNTNAKSNKEIQKTVNEQAIQDFCGKKKFCVIKSLFLPYMLLWNYIHTRKRIITLIALLILVLQGCDSKEEFKKHIPNKDAVMLYKEAVKMAMLENEYSEKVDSAITILERAISIDSLYIEPHFGIIRFARLDKDKTRAFNYCHRAQRIYKNYPEFFMIEGMIRESNNEGQKAKSLYGKALHIYENDLRDKITENPDLALNYIVCLYLNNQKLEAKNKLEEIKTKNKTNNLYNKLTIEILMEGYQEIRKR